MKKTLIKIFSKPKITIPVFAIFVLIVGFLVYGHIGQAPVVDLTINENNLNPTLDSNGNFSLAFPKSGRVESVLVNVGDVVHKGDILAKLSAPDQEGSVSQAKGALDLAQAQYVSLNAQYGTAKKQQDLIVTNAYKTLLSTDLAGIPDVQDSNTPIISGTYSCDKEGTYTLKPYVSGDADSGYSFNYSGIESGTASVKYENSVALGNCGLQIKFNHTNAFNQNVVWTITVPNTKSDYYLTNKNAYDLALANRDKVLSDLETNIGTDSGTSVAKAQVEAAKGAYNAALGAYQNNLIISPAEGVVSFVDKDLKVGQSVIANKTVIGITIN
jgi:pyruvate/2-oxoglutarate dehydrogenase complex dihydrolipoamide acyltransferase (E2) component